MSTRANICVEVPASEMGKTFSFKPFGFKVMAEECRRNKKTGAFKTIKKEVKPQPRPEITLTRKYIAIFHHWDSYPVSSMGYGLGMSLLTIDTFEKAINLVVGGDISSFHERQYRGAAEAIYQQAKESYKTQKARNQYIRDNMPETYPQQSNAPIADYQWNYLFRNGEWFCCSFHTDVHNWTPLRQVLADMISGRMTEDGYYVTK